jgi:hypothetical protein
MSMFAIESDVPAPAPRTTRVYEFDRMQVGESFLVPCEVTELSVTGQRVRWAVKDYRKRHAPETRWRTKASSKGIRVWRVE